MYAKKNNYNRGGRLEQMLAKYMRGGMVKYENGGGVLEREAEAPEEVSDLLEGLETLGKRESPLTGRELEERLERIRKEKQRATFSRDLRDPNLMFNRATEGEYSGLSDISDAIASKAESFYDDEMDKLRTQAYAITSSKPRPVKLPPHLQEGEFVEILRRAMEKNKM